MEISNTNARLLNSENIMVRRLEVILFGLVYLPIHKS